MSKTFKSSSQANDNRTLSVEKLYGEPRLMISGDVRMGFLLDPSDAPALALAVLEAAGVTETDSPYMHEAAVNLRAYILIEEKVSAAAREQAELEQEALELYNVCMTGHNLTSFNRFGGALRDQWLAVARKAREMRAEK